MILSDMFPKYCASKLSPATVFDGQMVEWLVKSDIFRRSSRFPAVVLTLNDCSAHGTGVIRIEPRLDASLTENVRAGQLEISVLITKLAYFD